jgi:hypothetical protein
MQIAQFWVYLVLTLGGMPASFGVSARRATSLMSRAV